MPRLDCDVFGCSARPILWLGPSAARRDLDWTAGGIHRMTVERRVRVCAEHAKECGVEQLVIPRTEEQGRLA